MQHVALINPPALKGFSNERTYSGGIGVSRKLKPGEVEGPIILPIDFLYTGAVAEKCGAKITFVDLLIDRLWGDEAVHFCEKQIGSANGDTWIGVRLSMPSLLQDLEFANRIKETFPDAKVFVFGTVIMATIDHWIRSCKVDFVIYAEPEAIFAELLAAPDWRKVKGIIIPRTFIPLTGLDLYEEGKQTTKYGDWVKVKNLSELPRPAWHLLDMKRYSPDGKDTSKVHLFVQASRGCPIGCNMCPYMLLEGKPWRSADIEGVVDEIEYLNKEFGIYRIRFRDPNFGFNRKYARELCDAIIARGVKLDATVETSIEVFDEDNLRKMYDAGMRTITTGIETDDADCMASIGQKISVNAKLKEKIDLCHKIGFHVYGTYCLGMPEETWATVRKTWMFAKALSVESGFTVLTPFPGTPMYWRALQEGLIPKEMRFSDWNSYTSTMRTHKLSTRDLDIARLWARLETIIPYRAATAGRDGLFKGWMSFYWKHIPHYVVRQLIRMYVWYQESKDRTSPEPIPSPPPLAEQHAA